MDEGRSSNPSAAETFRRIVSGGASSGPCGAETTFYYLRQMLVEKYFNIKALLICRLQVCTILISRLWNNDYPTGLEETYSVVIRTILLSRVSKATFSCTGSS